MNGHLDVLVVGAGPTGLTLALELTRCGVRPRLIDRGSDRAHESRALAIQPRSLEVLAPSGVGDALAAAGNPAVELQVHAPGRDVKAPLYDLGLADTRYPYLLFLSQAETERILSEHLAAAGVRVERNVELVDLASSGDCEVATLRHADGHDEAVSFRYVVGCDGAGSTVRRLSGIPFEGSAYPQTFVLADTEADGIEEGAAHVFLTDKGMLFCFPLVTPASWRIVAMRPHDDPTTPDAPVSLHELQALVDRYTDAAVRLRDPAWMTNFRIHHRAATQYRRCRVLLAGDAAHVHSPAGAQGMNTGIQDAVNLGWKLAHTLRRAHPALLDTYDLERAPIGQNVLAFTDRAFKVATSTSRVLRFARTRLAPTLIRLALRPRALRSRAFRTVSQLAIHYRESPISVNGQPSPRRGPKAGDRLPDAALVANGQPTTLHRITAAPRWHLLLWGQNDPSSATAMARYAKRLDIHRLSPRGTQDAAAKRSLGLRANQDAHYLVRPDVHIGYRSSGTDLKGAESYLDNGLPDPDTAYGPTRFW